MKHRRRTLRQGFTLIELLVVVAVIIILALIMATLYNDAQTQSRDVKIRDAAVKLADSIQLLSVKQNAGHPPRGGNGSTVASLSGKCSDGATGWAAYQHPAGTYKCTVADAVVDAGYLTADFFNDLPPNSKAGYATNKYVFMTYGCTTTKYPEAWLLFYAQETPSPDETDAFNKLLTECGYNPAGTVTQRDTYNMRGAILVPFSFSGYI